jgi:hypothetical protein
MAKTLGYDNSEWVLALILGVILFAFFIWFNHESDEDREIQQEEREIQQKTEAENIRKGFHCLSSWDGSHSEIVKLTKGRMNDPNSFEHVETKVKPVEDGRHLLFMTFRGKNAFGGTIVNRATATYANDGCTVSKLIIGQP